MVEYKMRGDRKGYHKSLYYEAINLVCHSCDHNGECSVHYKCFTLTQILTILYGDVE